MIIGALTGKKNSKQYLNKLSLKIKVNDRIHKVVFYDGKQINVDDVSDKEWARAAEKWIKIISKSAFPK